MLTCIRCGTILTFWARSNYCDNCARHMFASPKPIPLTDTPIYAEMMAELWREEFYGWKTRVLLGADQRRPVDQYTFTRKPLLKKGRRK